MENLKQEQMTIEKPNQNGINQNLDRDTLIKYLKSANIVGHLSDTETERFLEIAQAYGLNPFKREIYASKYGNNFSIVVGFETYIKRAERSGLLSGWSVVTEGTLDFKNVMSCDLKAIITIHRKDFKFPFIHEVFFNEYVQRKRDGSITQFWKNKPVTMIKKVAMSQGFRLCFSDELGGLPYTKEEIGQEEEVVEAEVLETTPTAPTKEIKQSKEDQDKVSTAIKARQITPTYATQSVFDAGVKARIEGAESKDQLLKLWSNYPDLQNDKAFCACISARKKVVLAGIPEIAKSAAEAAKPAEKVKINTEGRRGWDKTTNSLEYGVDEARKLVRACESLEDLMTFTERDQRGSVLKAAAAKKDQFIDSVEESQNEENDEE